MAVPWKKLLPRLWLKQKGKCFFCGVQTLCWRDAQHVAGATLAKSGKSIIINGEVIPAATVEHVNRLSEGGAKKGDNCVMACAHCNWRRDRRDQQIKQAKVDREKHGQTHSPHHRAHREKTGRRGNSRDQGDGVDGGSPGV